MNLLSDLNLKMKMANHKKEIQVLNQYNNDALIIDRNSKYNIILIETRSELTDDVQCIPVERDKINELIKILENCL